LPASPTSHDSEAQALSDARVRALASLNSLVSRRDVANLLGVSWQKLAWLVFAHRPEGYYKTWDINKKSGGSREIRAPRPALCHVQQELHGILMDVYAPRKPTHGFVRGRNVISNASPHVGRAFVLNVDIRDFFPTINFGRVRGLFLNYPFECNNVVATLLAQICCSGDVLPIGAPTSPAIANMICYRMDRELLALARNRGCWYTRYADDLTFSTDRAKFPADIAIADAGGVVVPGTRLAAILQDNGFEPNSEKTRLQTRHDRQVVTGIIVNERINVDRRYIRRIRAMLHAWATYGEEGAQAHLERWDLKDRRPGATPSFLRILRGRIAFLALVRGGADPIVQRFRAQFENLSAGRSINHGVPAASEVAKPFRSPLLEEERLLTVMFTDIVNSTKTAAKVGDKEWRRLLNSHNKLVLRELSLSGGREIKRTGDGFLAALESPVAALNCAKSIVSGTRALGIEVRIGLHLGLVSIGPDDAIGLTVHVAARVMGLANGSEILVSSTVREAALGSEIKFGPRRERKLKGLPGTWRLYRVLG
jgi:RNA-directed DNA polymerase